MLKKRAVPLLSFLFLLLLAGCACHEKKWQSRQQLKEELAKSLPDAPVFPEYEVDEKTRQVSLKGFLTEEERIARKKRKKGRKEGFPAEEVFAVEAKPAVADEEPVADDKIEISPGEKKEADSTEIKIEEGPVAIARRDVPAEPGKLIPQPKTEPAISAEKVFFDSWNGECLVYDVKWNFIKLGKALIASKEASNGYGDVYHLVAVTVPEGVLANMGVGYYRIDAYIDKKTLLPYYYYQYSKNRTKEDILEIYFDWKGLSYRWRLRKMEKGRLYGVKTETVKLEDAAYDGISSFYMVRTLDFEEKKSFSLPVALSEMWNLTVSKKGKRRENIPNFGPKDIYVIEPEAKSDEGFFTKGKMDIWITADSKRLPVYLEGQVPLGTARMALASETRISRDTNFDVATIARIISQVR